jgi:putative flippase GtrA
MVDATTLRFAAVGVANTLIGLISIDLCLSALKLGNVAANGLGYAVGIIVSFFLNKHWTFSHAGRLIPAFGRFLGVTSAAG